MSRDEYEVIESMTKTIDKVEAAFSGSDHNDIAIRAWCDQCRSMLSFLTLFGENKLNGMVFALLSHWVGETMTTLKGFDMLADLRTGLPSPMSMEEMIRRLTEDQE